MRRVTAIIATVFTALIGTSSIAYAQTPRLQWDVSPSENVAGYIVYYGVTSGVLTSSIDVGNTTQWVIDGLQPGLTYYFNVKAYNTSGLLSSPANQVSYAVPALPPYVAGPRTGLIWQHDVTGGLAEWEVDGTRQVSARLSYTDPAEGCEAEGADDRRREAPRRVLQTAVRIDEPRTERGHAWMVVEICRQSSEAPIAGGGVLVEDVDVAAGRGTDDGVVIRAEPRTVCLRDHADVGKALAHRVGGAVLRGVVEHDDLGVGAGQRVETREQELAAVRVDDRDAEIGQRARPRATSASRAASTESSAS